MNNPNTASQFYREVSTRTASPAELILMLYEGAIRFLEQAKNAFAFDDPLEFNQTVHNGIVKAQAIISELNVSLDMDKGKDCAANFRRLYDYLDQRLDEANRRKEEGGIVDAIQRITVLRDAWAEMMRKDSAAPTTHESLSIAA